MSFFSFGYISLNSGATLTIFSLFCFISEFVILSPLFMWSHERAPQRVSLAPEVANLVGQVRTGVNVLVVIILSF